MSAVRILIADNHEVVREGARILIEREPGWTVCAIATTGREALEQAKRHRPHVAILDMIMPDLSGLEAARRIRRALPATEVLIFTANEDEEAVHEVFEAGAKSYILKSEAASHLVGAIKALSEHKPFFTNKVSEILFRRFTDGRPRKDEGGRLTAREQEVLGLLAQGKSNKEVADVLGISIRTVETHRANILHRPEIGSIAGLVRYAIRHGVIEG
jgi:two-component system response regulator NreC